MRNTPWRGLQLYSILIKPDKMLLSPWKSAEIMLLCSLGLSTHEEQGIKDCIEVKLNDYKNK